MGILKQINYLAEKLTGTNPNKKEINQSIKYIADNYSGGEGEATSNIFMIDIDFAQDHSSATLITPYEDIVEAFDNNKILMISGIGFSTYKMSYDGSLNFGKAFEFLSPYVKSGSGGSPGVIHEIGWNSILIRPNGTVFLKYTDYEPEG